VLLDRRKVKFWQRIVFGGMAFLMAAFLIVGYSGVLNGCTVFNSAQDDLTQQLDRRIATDEAAVKADPKDAAAWASLGDSYLDRANTQPQGSKAQQADWGKATVAYARADKLLAKQKGPAVKQQRLDVLEKLVNAHLFLQDYQSATSVYGEITGLRPKDAQSFFEMASVAINGGDTDTALLAFSRFLELDPQSPDAPAVKDWIEQNAPSPAPTKGSGQ
jgi:cytochrome c-type biogenesis protein CcmH/NrfG